MAMLEDQIFVQGIGEQLRALDRVKEQNEMGMNRVDYDRWTAMRGVGDMAALLIKYRRQLTERHGADVYARVRQIADQYAKPMFCCEQVGDCINVIVFGRRMDKAAFPRYLTAVKAAGCRFNGDKRLWYFDVGVARAAVEALVTALEGIGLVHTGDLDTITFQAPVAATAQPQQQQKKYSTTVRIDKYDGMYRIRFPYHERLVALFSNKTGQLSGITEYNFENRWRTTTDLALIDEATAKIQATMSDVEVVEAAEIAADRRARDQRNAALQQPIPEVVAHLDPNYSLFAFQNGGVRFLQETETHAQGGLLAFEMGLGKTLTALSYAVTRSYRILVVGPKVTRRQWVDEAAKFFPGYFKGLEVTAAAARKLTDLAGYNIVSINYDSLEKIVDKLTGFDLLILDESHLIKNPKTKRYQVVEAAAKRIPRRVLLSGTAVKNKKVELFSQIALVKQGLFTSAQELKMDTIGGAWNKIQCVYMSRTKKDVMAHLPAKLTQIAGVEIAHVPADPREIGEVARAKNALALAKVPATIEFVENILDGSDSKVLVFSDSVEAATTIAEHFQEQALLHHGQMSDDRREQVKQEFRTNPGVRVFVTTRQSMMAGANMDVADKVVFNDLPWNAADLRQAEDRAHRVTSKNTVNVYWITASNSAFDTAIADIIKRKYELSRKITEGKQVSPEEREWMEKSIALSEVVISK